MKIGLFGGTFDPIHLGHLILAEQMREQAKLEQIWFIPSARPPHKSATIITSFELRCEMLRLGIEDNPFFQLLPIEASRPGWSYTADLLCQIGMDFPNIEKNLILGADSFVDLPNWYQPKQIVQQAKLLIAYRPHVVCPDPEKVAGKIGLLAGESLSVQFVPIPQMDIASRQIRQLVHEGKSIRYLVPAKVEQFIHQTGLYRTEPSQFAPASKGDL